MNWFLLSVIAMFCWSGSDFFSKIGCSDASQKRSYLKMVQAVGLVMGLHALIEIIGGVEINWYTVFTYLPISLLYIGSMTLGYLGLRYIELSISSPICNASGAVVAIVSIVLGQADMVPMQYVAVALSCIGVLCLGIADFTEDDELRAKRHAKSNRKYAKSIVAFVLPIAYCFLDAAGTFGDSLILETRLQEDSANVAYELTFAAAGALSLFYTAVIRRDPVFEKTTSARLGGAIMETAGQLAYIYAIADETHLAMSAPIIASYCILSVIWSGIFLKEKLSIKHYLSIALTVIGIIIMGVFDM